MKKKKLNSRQLAVLSIGLMRNHWSYRIKELFFFLNENSNDGSYVLYFDFDYYKNIMAAISTAYQTGSFAASNSENEWNDLMNTIESCYRRMKKANLVLILPEPPKWRVEAKINKWQKRKLNIISEVPA